MERNTLVQEVCINLLIIYNEKAYKIYNKWKELNKTKSESEDDDEEYVEPKSEKKSPKKEKKPLSLKKKDVKPSNESILKYVKVQNSTEPICIEDDEKDDLDFEDDDIEEIDDIEEVD